MKKIFQYSFAALAGLVLASCNGDYNDWAKPQSYNQEDPAAAYSVTTTPSSITMPVENDDVTLFSFSSPDERVKGYNIRTLTVNGQEIDYTINGNNVIASANALEDVAEITNESRAQDTYDLEIATEFGILLGNGDAVAGTANVTSEITTGETPEIDEKGYYLLGNFAENGAGWDLSAPIWMTDNGDGTYSAIVNTTGDGDNWFKFYEGSHYSKSDWDEVNLGQMGCKENGCSDRKGLIIWTDDKYEVQTPVISGKGEFKITIDMVNFNYKIVRQAVNYYIIGGPNDWNKSCEEKNLKFNQADIETPVYTILFPAAEEGDTWFAIGDEQACDAVAKENNWKLVYGTTSGNGNQGEKGTIKRRSELTDDGSFKVAEGAKFIQVTLDMSDNSYTVKAVNFSEYIYVPGNGQGWNPENAAALHSPGFDGIYTGYVYLDGGFKFTKARNWDDEYNWNDFKSVPSFINNGAGTDTNLYCDDPGVYYIVVNVAEGIIEATKIENMNLVGDFNSWNQADDAQQMTWDAENLCYTITDAAVNTNGWKFTANNAWDINLGCNDTVEPSTKIEDLIGGGKNIGVAGSTIKLYPCRTTSDKIYCTVE